MNYSSIHKQISVFLICAVFFSSINLPSSLADVRLPMIPHGPICYFNCCVCLNFGICISAGLQRGIKSQDKNAGTENAGKKMLISFAPLGSYSSCSFVFPLPTIAESDDVAAFYISFNCLFFCTGESLVLFFNLLRNICMCSNYCCLLTSFSLSTSNMSWVQGVCSENVQYLLSRTVCWQLPRMWAIEQVYLSVWGGGWSLARFWRKINV